MDYIHHAQTVSLVPFAAEIFVAVDVLPLPKGRNTDRLSNTNNATVGMLAHKYNLATEKLV